MLALLLFSTVTQALPGSWEVGYATWYGGVASGGGSCEFPKEVTASFPFGMYAAIDYTLYDDSKACGVCYEVECTGKPGWTMEPCECKATSVVLQADNSCCTRDHNTPHFDLNPAARAAILQNDCGNMAVRFRQVACPYNSEKKNIQIVPKPGTSVWWYGFFVWDVAGTGQVVKARIKSSGSSTWVDCPLQSGAYFLCDDPKPYTAPITVELTDIEGEVLVADDLITDPSKTGSWDFGTNFGKAGSPPVTRAPATSSPATRAPVTTTPAPQTGQPTTAPDTQSPDTKAPDTTAPDTAAPSTLVPGTTAEPTAEPTTAPDTAVPTVAPDTSAPATTAPATGAPLTSSPKTTSPSTNAVTSSPVGSDTTGAPTTASPGTGTTSSPGTSSSPSTASPGTTSSTGTASPGGTPTAVPTPSPSSDDGVAVWVWILVAVLGTACIVAMVAGAYMYRKCGEVQLSEFLAEGGSPDYLEMESASI
eukprot:TRINITY_DN523_c0_g1_i2.p1 TRINITY_DN523_c0_g1~~TRINITY_DN523_c0_g1_i2.p1  ORF type:complete len:495 (+),score=119.17 TRINITY_DN523_c0_g1_i2:57-1487(+)